MRTLILSLVYFPTLSIKAHVIQTYAIPVTMIGECAPPIAEDFSSLIPEHNDTTKTILLNSLIERNPLSTPQDLGPLIGIRNPIFPEPTPVPSAYLKDNGACFLLGAALGICGSLSPGFTTLNPTSQAHCLCYSSTVWSPDIFDGAVESCADFAVTAVPSAYGPLANLAGFCNDVGDIDSPKSTVAHITTSTATISASQTSVGCNAANSLLGKCIESTKGFNDLKPIDKAKCLCYMSSTSWVPKEFDGAVSTCLESAKTADMAAYAAVSPFVGLCASVGNVIATSKSSSYISTISRVTATTSSPKQYSSSVTGAIVTGPTWAATGSDLRTQSDVTFTDGGTSATKTGVQQTNKSQGSMRIVSKGEVIGISFCLSTVILFL